MAACETVSRNLDSEVLPRFYLPAGTRVTIIPENGNDCIELSHKLYELFAARGYYKLIDRANLGQTFEERSFQNMSFVENRPMDYISGVDAFLYLQAECQSGQSQTTDPISIIISPSALENNAEYVAIFRMVLVSNGQIVAARQIRLTGREAFVVFGAPAQPLVQKIRNKVAKQIFDSLHP
jgi:hypothetical protein